MLLESGDLIPVLSHAVEIPWTKRKNQIMAFLYRGKVTFQTMVYDSNVGDISPLSTYFNPRKWTVEDLNQRFGQVYDDENYQPSGFIPLSTTLTVSSDSNENKSSALTPRLILFAEHQKPEVVRPNVFQQAAEDPFYNFPTISVWRIPPPSVTTPEMTSKLPELRKSPDYQVSSEESNYEAIEPPKRRKLQSSDESLYLKSSMKTIQRPASTSCTWTPWIRNETLSPFINDAFESATDNVFNYDELDDIEDADDLKGVRDEQTLVKSLRKIAKAFESEDW